jgi:hypothetical protein
MREAIVLHKARMVHRDIRGTPIEVAYRIAARDHEVGDQLIGFGYGAAGKVHKTRLRSLPLGKEFIVLGDGEVAQLEVFHAGLELGQLRLRLLPGAMRQNGTIVFGAKMAAQLCGFLSALVHRESDGNQCDDEDDNRADDDYWFEMGSHPESCLRSTRLHTRDF